MPTRYFTLALALLAPTPLAAGQKKAEPPPEGKPLHVFRGTLDAKDPPDPVLRKVPHKVHEVRFEPGKVYQIDLKSQDFDAFLRLEDSRGKHLAHNNNAGGGTDALLVITTKEGGAYRLIATAFPKGQPSGAYTLTVRLADERGQLAVKARALQTRGEGHYLKGEHAEAARLLREALALWRQVYPASQHPHGHLDLANTLNVLGIALFAQGKAEALGHLEEALAIHKKVLPADHPRLATTLSNLGTLLRKLGRREEALRHLEEALAIRKKVQPPDLPLLAATLSSVAALLSELGRREEALRHYEQALAVQKKTTSPNLPQLATTLSNLGSLLKTLGRFEEALRHHEQALDIDRKTLPPDHPHLAICLGNLGGVLTDLGRFEEALRYHEQALAIFRKARPPNDSHTATCLSNLGAALDGLGRREEALRHLEQALAMYRKVQPGNHPDVALALSNVGNLLGELGRHEEALRHLEQALEIKKKVVPPGHPLMAGSLNNFGRLLSVLGRHEEALRYLEQALAIQKQSLPPNHPDLGRTLNYLGNVQNALGRHAEALRSLEQALAIRKKVLPAGHPLVAATLSNLSALLSALGRDEEAVRRLEEALAIQKNVLPADHPDLATTLSNLGVLLRGLGQREEALRHLEEALAILRKGLPANHPDLATCLSNLGNARSALGRHAEALESLEEALAVIKKALPADHPRLASCLNNLGLVLSTLGRRREALRHLEQALAIDRKSLPRDHPHLAITLSNLGSLLWVEGRRDEGRAMLADTVASSARYLRRIAAASAQRDHGPLTAQIQGRIAALLTTALEGAPAPAARRELLECVVQAKGIGTASLADRRDTLLRGASPQARAIADELLPLQRRLANLLLQGHGSLTPDEYHKECEALRVRVDALERDLGRAVQAFALLNAPPPTPEQLAERVPAGSVLVETVRYRPVDMAVWHGAGRWKPARYAALVLWSDGAGPQVRFVDLGDAELLERAVTAWRGAVQQGRVDARAEQTLRQSLWAPLAKGLPEKTTRLIVAPEGALALLPLEALRLADGKYLIERYAVQYISAGRDLMPLAAPGERSDVALVLADPDYQRLEGAGAKGAAGFSPAGLGAGLAFKSLPGFAREADAVAKLLAEHKGWRVEQARGAEASEERLAGVKRPRLLHCITHGFFLEDVKRDPARDLFRDLEIVGTSQPRLPSFGEDPRLRSGLALTGANKWRERSAKGLSDGLLTALEVENLDLWGTELVVLSACDTGRGEVQVGEGVLGLRRAFQLAGAQTVLASLWKVPDTETEQLMTDTLGRWLKGTSPHEALREAQLAMIRRLRAEGPRNATRGQAPPLYWAAFICHGNPR